LPAHDASGTDLALIEQAARDAGAIARRYFGGDYKRWDKGKGQPVTEADLAIDKFLHATLTEARPAYGWMSEESEDDPSRREAERAFIVDPIDGTTAFLKGRPWFTIAIAIVRDGRPEQGVVYNPITEECFAATRGAGATLNGTAIRVSECETIENCRMLAPKATFEHAIWSTPPNTPWPRMQVETRNSIAYRMALVAAGQFDATLALSAKHDWDLAAADIIVEEAGGLVTDHTGAQLHYNGAVPIQRSILCAGPPLHALLLEKLAHLGALVR
jgi:myo-inositol-1(or 4)-monophosphatase